MGRWPKPAEGSWTRALPGARHRSDLVRRLRVAGVLRARAGGDLQARVAERRPRRAAPEGRAATSRRTSRSRTRRSSSCATATTSCARSTTSAATAATGSCGTTSRARRPSGFCRQFVCKYHGWRYGLDGALTFIQQESEFFDVDKDAYGLAPVHCDVWNGFIFVNLDREPRQSLREFLGPMITALDDYPFGTLTEHYDFEAHNNSNWKLFADAFQEYYHVPSLHPQQIPPAVRPPEHDRRVRALPDSTDRIASSARPARAAGSCRPRRCTRSSARRAAGSSDRGRPRISGRCRPG